MWQTKFRHFEIDSRKVAKGVLKYKLLQMT